MHDEDPESALYRKKTCPACRTVVYHRPIPLFLVKSIAVVIDKAKEGGDSRSSPVPEGDPWHGIFPVDEPADMSDGGHSFDYGSDYGVPDWDPPDYGDDDDDYPDHHEYDSDDGYGPYDYGYGSDEDELPYEGTYVSSRWEPPVQDVGPNDYPFELSREMMSMLRRGATTPMIGIFDMSYTHEDGLRAVINGNILYLGWNIDLHPGDLNGEEFMEWVEADVYHHPERWERQDNEGDDHTWTAWRLIREDERAEDGEYETTDSEAYALYEGDSEGIYGGGGDDYEDYFDFD
jgi:hypothetical protein